MTNDVQRPLGYWTYDPPNERVMPIRFGRCHPPQRWRQGGWVHDAEVLHELLSPTEITEQSPERVAGEWCSNQSCTSPARD